MLVRDVYTSIQRAATHCVRRHSKDENGAEEPTKNSSFLHDRVCMSITRAC